MLEFVVNMKTAAMQQKNPTHYKESGTPLFKLVTAENIQFEDISQFCWTLVYIPFANSVDPDQRALRGAL